MSWYVIESTMNSTNHIGECDESEETDETDSKTTTFYVLTLGRGLFRNDIRVNTPGRNTQTQLKNRLCDRFSRSIREIFSHSEPRDVL